MDASLFTLMFRSPQSCKMRFFTALMVSIGVLPAVFSIRIAEKTCQYRLCVLLSGYG